MWKKVISLTIVFLLVAIVLIAGCQATAPQAGVETYNDTALGFSSNYPEGWEVAKNNVQAEDGNVFSEVHLFKKGTAGLTIWSKLVFEPDFPRDSFLLTESLDDYYYHYVTDPVRLIYQGIEGFKILKEKDTTVDKLPAKELTFTYNYNYSSVWKHTIIAFLDTRNIPFKIFWNEPLNIYNDYYQDFRLIVDTFRFTN